MTTHDPTSIPEAVTDLSRQEHFSAGDSNLMMDFVYELVNQYPFLLLAYVSEQRQMTITAESTQRFDPPQ